MKKILLLGIMSVFAIATGELAQAQSSQLKQANAAFERFQYADAIDGYEKVLEIDKKNREALERLALCHRFTGNYAKAEYWFGRAMRANKSDHSLKFSYAQALMSNGKYEEAEKQFGEYTKLLPKDTRGWRFLEYCQQLDQYLLDTAVYHVSSLPANSEASDFSPVLYQNGIVFASSRRDHLLEKKYAGNESFTDMYYTEPTTSGRWTQPQKLEGKTSNPYHEGPAAFNGKSNIMYITRNVGKGKAKKSGVANLRIYESQLVGGKWTEGRELPFCSEAYSVGHPAVSPDGATLYFTSDMPGGFGGKDIYFSQLRNGRWSAPRNMGANINSEGDEMFPTVQGDGSLHYASDGLGGFGGLDIFEAVQTGGEWAVKNVGYPINSPRDDFGISYAEGGKLAYFSSNRNGTDDLYVLNIVDEPQPVAGQAPQTGPDVYGAPANFGNETNSPLSAPKVGYIPESVEPMRTMYNKSYSSSGLGKEAGASTSTTNMVGSTATPADIASVTAATIEASSSNTARKIVLNGIVLNNNNKPLANERIVVEDVGTKERINLVSTANGNFYCGLNPGAAYVIRKIGPGNKPDAVSNIDTRNDQSNVFQVILKGTPTEEDVYGAPIGDFATVSPAGFASSTYRPSFDYYNVEDQGLWFRIQIGAFSKPLGEASDYLLKAGARIDRENTLRGLTRYVTGNFNHYPDAELYCQQLKGKGYPDAFVVAYFNDSRLELPANEVVMGSK